jgi:hypothetical protein
LTKQNSTQNYSRDKGHFLLIRGAMYQEDVRIVNIYATKVEAPNFM